MNLKNQNFQKLLLVFFSLTFTLNTQFVGNVCYSFSKNSKEVQPYSLLKGSCFDQRDLSLSGVSITIKTQLDLNKKKSKQKWQTSSDRRGEFAARLPAGERTFVITAKKKGFQLLEKKISFENDEQLHIVIRMKLSKY